MSIFIACLVGIFLAFFPTVMTVYYKSSSGAIIVTFILNLLGVFTAGISTLIAFIIAGVSIGLSNTLKSIMFAIVLIVVTFILFATELSIIFGTL